MSSLRVRDAVEVFFAAQFPLEPFFDLTAQWQELPEFLAAGGVTRNIPWIGIQYIGNSEDAITVPATNTSGKYREQGALFIHVVEPVSIGVGRKILLRAEAIRAAFRGRDIDGILKVEDVAPTNFEAGQTLQMEDGWTSGSILISYRSDLDL